MADDSYQLCLAIAERSARGELSAPLALMEMLIASEDVTVVERALARHPSLRRMFEDNRAGCERIAESLRNEPVERSEHTVAQSLSFSQKLFDTLVRQDEETSVALYSLGNPEILRAATQEIVDWLCTHELLRADVRVLDFGCGIGRMISALAAHVGFVEAIDLSVEMVAAARRRTAALRNVRIRASNGRDLSLFADASQELILAVDSFPYVVRAGPALVERLFAEVARVLAPGGALALLNFSYRGDLERDRADLAALAAQHRLTIVQHGECPFAIWNGAAFLLRR